MPSHRALISATWIFAICAGLLLAAAPAVADQRVTADHNNSVMWIRCRPTGGAMVITYAQPRARLQAAGIAPGAVLFRGRIDGTRIKGEARAFKKGCDAAAYPVEGAVEGDRITLNGPGPVRAGCRVERLDPASPHANLVFTGGPGVFATLGGSSGGSGVAPGPSSPGLRAAIFADPHEFVGTSRQVWVNCVPRNMTCPSTRFSSTHVPCCWTEDRRITVSSERLQMSAFYSLLDGKGAYEGRLSGAGLASGSRQVDQSAGRRACRPA